MKGWIKVPSMIKEDVDLQVINITCVISKSKNTYTEVKTVIGLVSGGAIETTVSEKEVMRLIALAVKSNT